MYIYIIVYNAYIYTIYIYIYIYINAYKVYIYAIYMYISITYKYI